MLTLHLIGLREILINNHWGKEIVMQRESIYNPEGSAYAEKIAALRNVLRARRDVQKSKEYADDPVWVDVLGSPAEIAHAEEIIENSLSVAARTFQKAELMQAMEDGMLSDGELREVAAAIRKQEMGARRSSNSEDENTHSKKQS
jgi:hypothetical protein